jgi:hypothetical protein
MSAVDTFKSEAKRLADTAIKNFRAQGLGKETIGEMVTFVQVLSDAVALLKTQMADLSEALLAKKPQLKDELATIVKSEISRFTKAVK